MYLDSIKSSKVYVSENIVPNSKTAVVLIHGLAEHSGRYDNFINELNQNSISVFAMDLRGHGKSVGKNGDSENIEKVLNDVDLVVEYVKSKYCFDSLGIFGHSIGGLVASLFASKNVDINFLVLSSPAIYLPNKLRIIKFIPYKILPFIKVKKNYSESKEMLQVSRTDKLALNRMSLRTIGVYFNEGINKLKSVLIKCPTLIIYGGKDPLLNEEEKLKEFFEKIDNDNKQMVCYKESKHRIVQNENAAQHINDIIDWIKNINI